jgi:mono/diheme cytochrome c family protein
MSEEDLKALIAYLRSLKAVRKETPALKTWAPSTAQPAPSFGFNSSAVFPILLLRLLRAASSGGRYLVEHVALCIDCHTPRNFIGVPDRSLYLSGAKKGPLGEEIPNITPDKETSRPASRT